MIVDKSESYPAEEVLPEDGSCKYLYQPSEQHGDQKIRATNFM